MKLTNPWVDPFKAAASIDYIRTKTRISAQPLYRLDECLMEVACAKIKQAFSETFIPTLQSCQVMKTFIEMAQSYAEIAYADEHIFMRGVYGAKKIKDPYPPIIFTGPAGVGKSEVRKALVRLFEPVGSIKVNEEHPTFPLKPVNVVVANEKHAVSSLLKPLTSPEVQNGAVRITNDGLVAESARWMYLCGCCLLILDELQFFTRSSSANNLIANAMTSFSCIGPPNIVICNYSLGHRLMTRNQEDRQRLLTRPIVLLPDPPQSPDWILVLMELQKIVPDVYQFSFKEKAIELWNLTAGLKRLLVSLLLIAYRLARKSHGVPVNWVDIEKAYQSNDYLSDREDVNKFILNGMFGTGLPMDLTCPFPVPQTDEQEINQGLKDARERMVAESAALSAMTVQERDQLFRAQRDVEKVEITEIEEKKNRSPKRARSASELIKGAKKFRGNDE